MNNTTDHQLSKFGLNYNFNEKNLYKFNLTTKHITKVKKHFTWTRECNDFYETDIDAVWEEVFTLLNPIEFQTTRKIIDTVRIFSDGTRVKPEKTIGQTEFIDIPHTVPTGYVIPKYNFLSYKLNGGVYYNLEDEAVFSENKEAYNEAIKLFPLDEDSKIEVNEYTDIGNYRNVLHSQIERQADQIQNIHREIADILKIYYYESEKAIVKTKMSEQSEKKIGIIDQDWHSIKRGLSTLYQAKIQGGMSLNDIKSHYERDKESQKRNAEEYGYEYGDFEPFQLDNDKYVPKEILKFILDGYEEYMKQKDILIDTSLALAKKIAPLESLLEDFFFDRKIKSAEEFNLSRIRNLLHKYQGEEYWKTFNQYRVEEGDMEVAYDRLIKEMEEIGLEIRHTTFFSFKSTYYRERRGY